MNGQPQGLVLSRDASRALDALVAEKVMGCVRVYANSRGEVFGAPPELIASGDIPRDHGRVQLPRYSTDIAAAWTVPPKIARRYPEFVRAMGALLRDESPFLTDLAGLLALTDAEAASMICRAALAAVEAV